MTTSSANDTQAQLDTLRAGLVEIGNRLLGHQRQLDYVTSRVLMTRDRDVPEMVDNWNRSPPVRQLADGRLDLAAPKLRPWRYDPPLEVQSTRVDVTGGAITLTGTSIALRGEPIELAGAPLRIHAGRVTITGQLRCSTIQARNFVAKIYKTGAGNVW